MVRYMLVVFLLVDKMGRHSGTGLEGIEDGLWRS
jgi:hypothetical protein